MKPDQPYGMTSREAAALYLSGGATDDPGLASMLDYAKKQPELLIPKGYVGMVDYEAPKLVIDDPDANKRRDISKKLGFDFSVELDVDNHKATFKNAEYKLTTRCKLSGSSLVDASNMAAAVLRLQTKYEVKRG